MSYVSFFVLYRAPPLRKRSLSQRNQTKLFLKRSTCSSVEDFEKAVGVVTYDKKVLVVLQKNLTYLVKP